MNTARRELLKFAGYGMAAEVSVSPTYGKIGVKESPGSSSIYDVREFGASGDGKAVDTSAINKAIEAASNAGGGMVYFGAGTYLCYSLHLRSNVALYLEQGAIIQAADTPMVGTTSGGYDAAESNAPWEEYQDFGHNHWHNSLLLLLCYKGSRRQHGHLGRERARCVAIWQRRVAIECGLCRSVRVGSAARHVVCLGMW